MVKNLKNKFFVIFVIMFSMMFINGCSLSFIGNDDIDSSVNMTPRVISLQGEMSTSDVVANVKSAIVGIKSTISNGYAVGSGVAIRQGGYILTNQHVIDSAKSITIYFADKQSTQATLIWQDASMDLAVIKSAKDMPYLECENQNVTVGEDVLAIGTPLSLAFGHTVTKGIVSALDRTIEINNINGSKSYMQNLIQHDASINPGNSGGPLINHSGKVIGINTLKANDAEGIGFAIPIIAGQSVVERLAVNNGFSAPYMGVMGVSTDFARAKDFSISNDGLYLMGVDSKSSAGLSGIKAGDIIYKIDDTPIYNFMDLRKFIYSHSIGDSVTVYLYRSGLAMTMKITLTEK